MEAINILRHNMWLKKLLLWPLKLIKKLFDLTIEKLFSKVANAIATLIIIFLIGLIAYFFNK